MKKYYEEPDISVVKLGSDIIMASGEDTIIDAAKLWND